MIDNQITRDKREINQYLPDRFMFCGYASFEKRCTTVPLSIEKSRIDKALIFTSKHNSDGEAKETIKGYLEDLVEFVELDIANPVSVARRLTEVARSLFANNPLSLVIDITTFTHENLLMFLKLVSNNKEKFLSVLCLYNGAEEYSGDVPHEEVWLSKGCKDVRNVIGYPGLLRPAAKTCLVILTGFELERATKLIEWLEPDSLALGYPSDPTSENHVDIMNYYKHKFDKWQSNYKNNDIPPFQFSSKCVIATVDVLEAIVSGNSDHNYIFVPLNTKLSTVAAAIVAQRHRQIQVCYTIPEIYNVENYSKPSQNITIFHLE